MLVVHTHLLLLQPKSLGRKVASVKPRSLGLRGFAEYIEGIGLNEFILIN
ncbi:hypothetical protein GW626_04545 [Peribacillus muralis]|nr:hypothetical protein [Peribacillus muralis]MCK1993102.1 hypothetical protein [Peribacillus muralis]MCK2013657.1 hypothetical protein [Peribacillus muralis]